MPLFIDLKTDESVTVDGGRIKITLEKKSGQAARLAFVADKEITIEHNKEQGKNIASLGITRTA